MKLIATCLFLIVMASSCMNPFAQRVKGDGNITTLDRSISSAQKITCAGSYDVQLTQGSPASLKIVADNNLQPYIVADQNGDELKIHTQDNINIDPTQKIKIILTTDKIEDFKLTGNGDVNTTNKFTGGDYLNLSIAGNGNIHFDVNAPQVNSNIAGSGDIYVSGETKNSKIEIAGSGNYHADGLKSENVKIKIAGTGDSYIFADSTLDINIAGVGNVNYKGNATVTQNIAGSGKIKKIE